MKRLVLALASAIPFSTLQAGDPAPLQAGAFATDITPKEFPINMPGGFAGNLATSAHDPLHARSLVLKEGTNIVALVVVDNLGAPPEVLNEAKIAASERTGIPVEKILVSSTHTHTAPSANSRESSGPGAAYRKLFVEGVAESIVGAHGALQPASVGAGKHALPDEVFNRRWYLKPGRMKPNPFGKMDLVKMNPDPSWNVLDRPAGPTDPDVVVLSLQDSKRRPLALFANYALHYVGGIPPAQVSADYFGEFARVIPSRFRADQSFVGMLSNGASGDINNLPFGVVRPPREPFEQVRIVAQKTADAAWFAAQSIEKYESQARLGMIQRDVTLRFRRPTEEQLAEARAIVAIKDKDAIAQLPNLAQNYARSTIAAAERTEETLTVQLQALRVGNFAICGVPFETFVEMGLDLKKRSPFLQTMVIGLANGRHGYLPTAEQHPLGGYETWIGTNVVQEDASVILTKHLLEMLEALHALQ